MSNDINKAILVLTDFMDGHWEDPEWGTLQDMMARAAILQLSKNIKDSVIRKTIEKAAIKDMPRAKRVIR